MRDIVHPIVPSHVGTRGKSRVSGNRFAMSAYADPVTARPITSGVINLRMRMILMLILIYPDNGGSQIFFMPRI